MLTSERPPDLRHELGLLLRSRVSIVYLDTVEEVRASQLVGEVARSLGRPFFTWSMARGIQMEGAEEPDRETREPAAALGAIHTQAGESVYLMCDLDAHINEPLVARLMLEIAQDNRATLVLVGSHGEVPAGLRIHAGVLALPRPDIELIDTQIRAQIARLGARGSQVNELDRAQVAELARALRGLTLEEVEQTLTWLIEHDGKLAPDDIAEAVRQKGRLLARSGVVELTVTTTGLDWVAGFDELKAWAAVRKRAFTPEAQKFGLPAPRGVLLTGVPGCGKSHVVKALAHEWNMPLLRLDAGALFDKFIGASEKNLREALRTAGALAPSVLWIDEIEKGFASSGPADSDGGLAYRMVGMLATWMQERPQPVFLAATSNDITLLPPELTRQGRFDEIFFVDLPELPARQHLFAMQLARRDRDWQQFDCAALATASASFSGSEIEQSVSNALYRAFAAGRDITTADVLHEIGATRPLARTAPEKVAKIRLWGKEHARPV